jgi:excinuclease ABC subunit A
VTRHLGSHGATAEDEPDPGEPAAVVLDLDHDASIGVSAEGIDAIDRLITVDQRPIGRTPRSNLATYTGMFDTVRSVFAATDEARRRGWTAGRFSFNVAEGRCPTCQGEGFVAVELLFLPGTYAPCPTRHGARYAEETLEVRYRATVRSPTSWRWRWTRRRNSWPTSRVRRGACERCARSGSAICGSGNPPPSSPAARPSESSWRPSCSGPRRGHTLYVLDEPTTGLTRPTSNCWTASCIAWSTRGNTVVVAEHDMDVVAGADWVIDLGPGAGDDGGRVVAAGTPEEVAEVKESRTAPYLSARLGPSVRVPA